MLAWYLQQMEQRLSEQDKRFLKTIYEPQVVGVPLEDARRTLCVMPDGEIRSYGAINKKHVYDHGEPAYLASRDCGLSWKLYAAESPAVLGASTRSPYSGKYITIKSVDQGVKDGTYVCSSVIGPDDPNPAVKKIADDTFHDIYHPLALESRKRLISTAFRVADGNYRPTVMISDDDGETWTIKTLPSTPKHEPVWPHLDVRWQNNGAEPVVTELPGGRLMLLARTSLDFFYVYYSDDGGDTWTDGELSDFHGTLTTPYFLRFSDGRTLLFWCNTRPLPELRHDTQWPPLEEKIIRGESEDVFTNRDACHAAVSEDGVHWTGFRELYLSALRNDADFRTKGGRISSNDKSVHQFQAIELPYGKVLVALGQHEISRKMVIFDVNWLYEKSRSEDFQKGLVNVSAQVFVKSVSGHTPIYGFTGHCAWNRTNGALLVPDPEGTHGEALQLARIRDPRLFSEVQGAAWNFPAAASGEMTLEIRIAGSGVRLSLADHWIHPIDVTVSHYAPFSFTLTSDCVPQDEWHTARIRYSLQAGFAEVFLGERLLFKVRKTMEAPFGISYLHLQSLAESEDPYGTYVRRLHFQAIE